MSESAAAPRPQPTPGPAGRISILFDVIDAPSISYADAVDAVMHDSGSIPPSPPQWGHSTKGVAGFFGSMFRPSAKNSAQARAALDSQASLSLAILKMKYSDHVVVHRRILVTIWRLFCKWNSTAAVAALQKARQQAYAECSSVDQQHSGDVSSSTASASYTCPLDGSPQVAISDSMNPLRFGSHWSVLGFQSDDPVSDLRGSGMLGLLQLLWLLSSHDALPGWCAINQCWREKRGSDDDAFPLAIVSINFTCVAFDAFSRGKLAAQVERAHSSGATMPVLQCINTFYGGCFLCMASTFSKRQLTIDRFSEVTEHIQRIVSKTPHKIFNFWLSVEPATSEMLSPISPASPENIVRLELPSGSAVSADAPHPTRSSAAADRAGRVSSPP